MGCQFPSKNDRFDVPAVEYATLKLAEEAGIRVPALRLETLGNGRRLLLSKRFDIALDPTAPNCVVTT